MSDFGQKQIFIIPLTWLNGGDDLHGRRTTSDHCHSLAFQVVRVVPLRRVHQFTFEQVETGNVGPFPCAITALVDDVEVRVIRPVQHALQYPGTVDQNIAMVLKM